MYMGDPHRVAAIMLLWRYRAKPKSAVGQKWDKKTVRSRVLLLLTQSFVFGARGAEHTCLLTVTKGAERIGPSSFRSSTQ